METSSFQHETVSQEGREEEEQEDEALPVLPDDVLVQVFAYLQVPEVLAARLVCRRWAALALDADVWRDRKVDDSLEAVLGPTLRLAPCLRGLSLSDIRRYSAALAKLAATTECAAKSVYVCFYKYESFGDDDDNEEEDDDDDEAAIATINSILENQERLGRLRDLFLDLSMETLDRAPLESLIPSACSVEGLTELTVCCSSDAVLKPDWLSSARVLSAARPRASLKKLTLDLMNASAVPDLLRVTIGCHAETLESLSFKGPINNRLQRAYRPKAELVAKAVGLRELRCPLLHGMADLVKCDRLESLNLEVDACGTDVAILDEAKDYLRKATQVKRLKLKECDLAVGAKVLSMAVDLVEALASSRRSELQVLTFSPFWKSLPADGELSGRLAAALGLLPALRELRVDAEFMFHFSDVFLLLECVSRSAGAGPLTLRLQTDRELPLCLHAWVHEEAERLQKLLDARPGLHLEFDLARGSHRRNGLAVFQCGRYRCKPCVKGCHADVGGESRVAFHGHADQDQDQDDGDGRCDAALHADPGVRCYRLPPAPRLLRADRRATFGGHRPARYRL